MSKESQTYEKKKQSSIVQKPFQKGKVNLFHPPKKNPNGHLASSKLWDDKLSHWEEAQSANKPEPQIVESNGFFNAWKLSAIFIIIFSNIAVATAILIEKKQSQSIALLAESEKPTYISGKTNLAAQEFIELNINSLKNISVGSAKTAPENIQTTPDNPIENLLLAVPPTNLPEDIVLPQAENDTKYYYILTQYTGDRSLEIAKTKVPNVSLVNFPQGMFIYMGAFTKKDLAHKFVKQLKDFGLEGYVYPFE